MLSVEYISSMFAMFTTSHTHTWASIARAQCDVLRLRSTGWTNEKKKHFEYNGNERINTVHYMAIYGITKWWFFRVFARHLGGFFSPACLSFSIVLDSDLIDATHFYGIITHIAQTTARWQHSSVFWKTARNEAGRTSNHIRNGSHIKAESQNITDLCTRNYIWQMSGRVWLMCYISLGRPTWTTLNCPNV